MCSGVGVSINYQNLGNNFEYSLPDIRRGEKQTVPSQTNVIANFRTRINCNAHTSFKANLLVQGAKCKQEKFYNLYF